MGWFTKFLLSKFSGWMFLVSLAGVLGLSALVGKVIYDYKDLQVKAARCEATNDKLEELAALRNRVSDSIKSDAEGVKAEVNRIKEDAEQQREANPEAPLAPSGCAAERAPDPILRYHGWLRD